MSDYVRQYLDNSRRLLVGGYSDLGIMFPFAVGRFILTDLDDGKQWLVSWNDTVASLDGFGHITLNDDLTILPHRLSERFIIYGPGEGPYFNDGQYMLIVRSGHLGFNFIPFENGVSANASSVKPYAQLGSRTPRLLYITGTRAAWTPEFRQ